MKNNMKTDIVIVGGGISGLHTAYQLQKRGVDFILIEARDRLGGRILSKNYPTKASQNFEVYNAKKPAYDLGPSWFWPGQRHMENLINELKLTESVFHQQASGESVYEDQQGNIQTGFYGISMEGTYRVNGGMRQIITNLEEKIQKTSIFQSTQTTDIALDNNQILISAKNSNNEEIQIICNKVVMALPPRIALSTIKYNPPLTDNRTDELNSYATWMAGHAKILISYDKPFWLNNGLSGDAVSHLGSLREIHDASSSPSSKGDDGYALFGFVGIPSSYRNGNEDEIRKAAIEQLIRMFGEDAADPLEIVLQDWAQETYTASEVDQTMSGGHATSSMSHFTETTFDDRLIWSGTETADHLLGMNGLLEGALEASVRTLNLLTSK